MKELQLIELENVYGGGFFYDVAVWLGGALHSTYPPDASASYANDAEYIRANDSSGLL